jgi:hypothetical protein
MGSTAKKPAPPPPPAAPPPMPSETDQQTLEAADKDKRRIKNATGRKSTILTGALSSPVDNTAKKLLG